MAISSVVLASGNGWRVQDVHCTYGPGDVPFEEQHDGMRIALVTGGTFTYRTLQGTAVLAPGAALLGNHQECFECRHEHAVGDRCLSFRFSPELLESVLSQLPGINPTRFAVPSLPPLAELIPVVADAGAAMQGNAEVSFEELALTVIARVGAALAGLGPAQRRRQQARASRRDRQRVTEALLRIEAGPEEELSLQALACAAAMSPYHFLRTFRSVAGMTPHQFLLHTRLQRAAARLRSSNEAVSAIAADAGFSDLSTFNRRFRRLLGATPTAYRLLGVRKAHFRAVVYTSPPIYRRSKRIPT